MWDLLRADFGWQASRRRYRVMAASDAASCCQLPAVFVMREIDRAIELARNVPGARPVKNDLRLK